MKKTLFFILMILVLMVSSCNLFLKEEYGELILSFDGSLPDGARALDSNGLPVLSSSPMKIDIIREDGYTVTRELGAEEPKSLIELVPIGEKIEIIVTAINPSGQWSGRASHTVVSGQNHVRVLLNKNISGLKNLLFTQKKTDDPSTPYNLTFYMDGKEINAPGSKEEYSFARDSKGRLYVRYKPNDTYLARYTSEGKFFDRDMTSIDFLANDYTTGTMYGLLGTSIKKIEENLTLTSPFSTSPPVSAPFAADNGIFTWASIGSSVIRLWKDGMPLSGVQGSFSVQTHAYNLGTNDGFAIKDIFIRNGYGYVLCAGVQSNISHGLYSLGAVLKWKIGTDPANGNPRFEGSPVVLGKSAGSPVIENSVLKNYDYSKNFYGAVKVIGFDEENIYIADDGFDAAYFAENPHIVKNRNRIAALNIATNTLSFSDERTAKWYNEWKEWKMPNTKTLLWEKDPDNPLYMRYWTSTNGAEASSAANKLFEYSAAKQPTDVFCYDQDGNLYIMYDDAAANKYVRRFALKEDGSYEKLGLDLSSSLTSAPISAIAVDISEGRNSLYYVYTAELSGNTHAFLQRRTWNLGDTFDHASPDLSYLRRFNPNTSVTALAANKDGVFAGIKETYREGGIDKYRLKVQKYAKINNPAHLDGELTLVDNAPEYTDSSGTPIGSGSPMENIRIHYGEAINDLQVFDGFLYALSSKSCEIQNKDGFAYFTDAFKNSGTLYKIGSTNGSLSENAVVLAKKDWNDTTKIGYGFYRFIAVKYDEAERIKLIIASDSAWGKDGLPIGNPLGELKNTDKVLEYDLKGSLQGEQNSGGSFSKTLKLGSGFEWY